MLPTLNRSAVVLRPKQPFLEWAATVHKDDPQTAEETRAAFTQDRTVFLLPEYNSDQVAAENLSDFAQLLFEEMLQSWSLDMNAWPSDREWETFQEWFEFECFSMVVDAFEEKLELSE